MTERSRRGPYQGLTPYTEADAAYFFGRDTARDVVLDNLLAYRVSVLYGQSGVGKSSLLRAGVARHVLDEGRRRIEGGEQAEYAALVFGAWFGDPVSGLEAAIHGMLERLSAPLAAGLPSGSLADTVSAAVQRLDGSLLVILDQFEEYFLYHDADGPFIAELARIVARRDVAASVLVSIREDAVAKLDALADDLPGLLDNLVRVEHLDRTAARAAIEAPLELWNRQEVRSGEDVRIEPALVDAVLDGVQAGGFDGGELDGAGAAAGRGADVRIQTPYLQLVLTKLWEEEQRAGSRVLRLRTLERLRGAERIVATHVDTAIAKLSPAEQAVAARILRQLVTPSGTKIALRATDLAEYAELDTPTVTAVLERLTREARILQALGDARYEIYHDALARPILDWRRRWQADQERVAAQRRIRVVTAIASGLLLTAIVVAVLAILALNGRRDARREADEARSVALASVAGDQLGAQPDVALLLALGALRERDRPEARDSMIAAREAVGPAATAAIMRGHAGVVNGVTFARRGRLVASAGGDGRIALWDAVTHRRLGGLLATAATEFTCIALSPDGRTLAAGAGDGRIGLWDLASRRRLGTLAGSRSGVLSVAFSPDGRVLASAGEEHGIRLWDVRARAQLGRPLPVRDRRTLRVAFSPDGRTLASVGSLYRVRLWSVRSRSLQRTFRLSGGAPLTSVAYSPDGRTLAVGGDDAWLWNPTSGRRRKLTATPRRTIVVDDASGRVFDTGGREGIGDVAFSPDGRRLAGAGDDGRIRLWDVVRPRLLRVISGPTRYLNAIAFSPDGRTLAAGGGDRKVWLVRAAVPRTLRHADGVNAVAFDRAGRVLATAANDGRITLWDVRSRRALTPALNGGGAATSVAFAPGGRTLASGGDDGLVLLWDLRTRRRLRPPLAGHADAVNGVAFSPDGRMLASAANDGTIVLWDARSHRRLGDPLRGHASEVNAVAFSPGGRMLASAGSDGQVRLWDVRSRRPLGRALVRHADMVNGVAFSPDGTTLASAGSDGNIWLADIASRRLRGPLSGGDAAAVLSISFTPDGSALVAGYEDGAIRLWDVGSRRQLGRALAGHEYAVNGVAVRPDGRTFASGSSDFTARIWPRIIWSDRERLADEICDLVGSGFSRGEWAQYAPGVHYLSVCDR